MTSWRWLLGGTAVLVVAAAAAISARGAPSDSPVPSVHNAGAAGTRALYLYWRERGLEVGVLDTPLAAPPSAGTLVIAAPQARAVGAAEREVLAGFVERGGRLIYLTPPTGAPNALDRWLDLRRGPSVRTAPQPGDPGGAPARVLPVSGIQGGLELRVGDGASLRSHHPRAIPLAVVDELPVALRFPMGEGDVIVFAGPDLAQNGRLALAGNLRLWDTLVRGPVLFDELHHTPPGRPPMSLGITAFVLQLALIALVLALARGTRFGRPRISAPVVHRHTREYLDAMATLTRRAGVERELALELLARLRLRLHERYGISTLATAEQAGEQLEALTGVARATLVELHQAPEGRFGKREYVRFTRRCAHLAAMLDGRAVPSSP